MIKRKKKKERKKKTTTNPTVGRVKKRHPSFALPYFFLSPSLGFFTSLVSLSYANAEA
tara:strand:- start:1618 stop:1791 length:174 start_codon:yes stop_codon:yes gene_type:complete